MSDQITTLSFTIDFCKYVYLIVQINIHNNYKSTQYTTVKWINIYYTYLFEELSELTDNTSKYYAYLYCGTMHQILLLLFEEIQF